MKDKSGFPLILLNPVEKVWSSSDENLRIAD